MTQAGIQQAVESIWALFRETDRRLDQQSRETDRRFKETDRRLDRIMAETQREIATLSKRIRATEGLFTGQWGRLMEALVRPGVVRLFQDRGIPVSRTQERVRARRDGKAMELDLLLVNGEALVIVEVKTTLRADHVRELLEDLQTFCCGRATIGI